MNNKNIYRPLINKYINTFFSKYKIDRDDVPVNKLRIISTRIKNTVMNKISVGEHYNMRDVFDELYDIVKKDNKNNIKE